jgi:hypothetical protein
MAFDITDTPLAVNEQDVVIANGGNYVINVNDFTIPAGASDPYLNTVDVHATIAGFPNTYDDSASASTNLFQPAITVEKVADTGQTDDHATYVGGNVHYTFTVTNTSSDDTPDLLLDSLDDTVLGVLTGYIPVGGDVLSFEESYTFSVDRAVLDTDPDPLPNTVTVHYHPEGFSNDITDSASEEVDIIHPHTTMTSAAYVYDTVSGNVEITITDKNDGDVPLTDAHIHLLANSVEYGFSPLGFGDDDWSSDGNNDDIMDPGESWTWHVVVTISTTTFFETWGHGIDPLGGHVDYPEVQSEYRSFTVEVGFATRTQGFWATHLDFTEYVFETYLGSYIDLGYKQIDTMEELMGIFWANNAKESDGDKRTKLCQARQTTAQQAIAAILNQAMPGGAPLPAGITLTSIANTLAGTDIQAIKNLGAALDAYNNSGDDVALDPGLPPTGRAEPQAAKGIADIPFADCN